MSRNVEQIRPAYDEPNPRRNKAEFWNIVIFELGGTSLLVYGSLSSE